MDFYIIRVFDSGIILRILVHLISIAFSTNLLYFI